MSSFPFAGDFAAGGVPARKLQPVLWGSALLSILAAALLAAAILQVIGQAVPVFQREGLSFITGGEWFYRRDQFGALGMIYGTIVVALVAMVLAFPLGAGAALFTSEYLPRRWRIIVKGGIELLAGIPSVVYGLLGVLLLREWLYHLLTPFDPLSGDSLLTAGVLLAVMILPTIMTLCDDALQAIPAAQRSAARGLGLTHAESVLHVVLPQAWRGMAAAGFLGLGRAFGETVAVFLVVGRQDNQLPSPWFSLRRWIEPGQTLTSKLGGPETHLAYGSPLHWAAILGLAVILLVLAVACLAAARSIGKLWKHGDA